MSACGGPTASPRGLTTRSTSPPRASRTACGSSPRPGRRCARNCGASITGPDGPKGAKPWNGAPGRPLWAHRNNLHRISPMADLTAIKEHMDVIGADGVHVGTVDKVEGDRIKLTRADSGEGSHKGHHHFIAAGLVTGIDGGKVRLSANGDVAVTMEQEKAG